MQNKPFSLSNLTVYFFFLLACAALFYVLPNEEPFALALLFAALNAGLSPVGCPILYGLSSLVSFSLSPLPYRLAEGIILGAIFLIFRKIKGKTPPFVAFLALAAALAVFLFFAPFHLYPLPPFLQFAEDAILQKAAISALIFLLAAAFSIAVKALLFKFLKCRLHGDELVFSVLLALLIGTGICRAASVVTYMGIAFFLLLLFAYVTKDASAWGCAFVLSLPPALAFGISPERFFVYGAAVCLFCKFGRLSAVLALVAAFFAYGYFDGIFFLENSLLVKNVLSALLPAILFLALPSAWVRSAENKLIFYRERHLPRIAINRNRAAIGEQLFEISAVFREIQTTFSSLGSTEAQDGAKAYIHGCVKESVCKRCANYRSCIQKGLDESLTKLIEVGAAKSRVSLIDVPQDLSAVCVNQSGLLYDINRRLGDYRKYMLETENAADGRNLLAGQARGVSEILKNIALEQSAPLNVYTEQEKRLDIALLKVGVVCSEVMVSGEGDRLTLSLVTFGKADVKKIAAVASEVFGANMMISERLTLNKDKFCCILRRKPVFDAAFGVASVKKAGESASGDTHSVIKIDERRFMIALSDGMGSGEYARRISESTISLLESFYRAKMPSETVLSTINKLLTFNKEETFACVDIAVVDLDTGHADVVKIGSPIGFILSDNTLRILEGGSLPLGILESLHPTTASYTLQAGDILLFLSDGITSAFGSSADLYEALKHIPTANPQQMADTLLKQALHLYGGVAKDDMTALAVRLFRSA